MLHKRRKKAVKRLDLSAIKESLKDSRLWACLGVVKAEGTGAYYELSDDDVLVEVQLQPSQTHITARLGTIGGSFGAGVWAVPPEGAEVLVVFPDGDLTLAPVITCLYTSGSLPESVGPTTLVVACPASGQVLIHDGSGATHKLVTKEAFAAHKHPTGTGPSGPPDNSTADSSYTAVLEAK